MVLSLHAKHSETAPFFSCRQNAGLALFASKNLCRQMLHMLMLMLVLLIMAMMMVMLMMLMMMVMMMMMMLMPPRMLPFCLVRVTLALFFFCLSVTMS